MITRKSHTLLSLLSSQPTYICAPCRRLHKHISARRIPDPTPFVPDTTTFLTLIGRELSKHAPKFTSWNDLFTLSSPQLKEMGIEPARSRRYLLRWREKFRKGEFGIGGDLQYVQDGVGELRVVELPKLPSGTTTAPRDTSTSHLPTTQKLIINVPPGSGQRRPPPVAWPVYSRPEETCRREITAWTRDIGIIYPARGGDERECSAIEGGGGNVGA